MNEGGILTLVYHQCLTLGEQIEIYSHPQEKSHDNRTCLFSRLRHFLFCLTKITKLQTALCQSFFTHSLKSP